MQLLEYFIKNALLFKANDYLCRQNNKRSLLMQKLATKSNSLVSKSLPV
ncbi:hypothetical protein HMPREF0973_02755 [Prevotella veroralis F0319]|uniref:Uncharacterized protein n=1 Tax=Prevotella veroralis F0319 TaxID=649761 RepID=C9MSY6_9BACT|nr:hypothetical protein HMPREF0973_02755 [Prevotella veroralis F0319]